MAKYCKSPPELGINVNTSGIYVMTDDPRIEAMMRTGILNFGIGDTTKRTIANRMGTLSSSKNPVWEKCVLDTITNPGYRDHRLHKIVRETCAAQLPTPYSARYSEIFQIAVDAELVSDFSKTKDFEPIRQWLIKKIRKCAATLDPAHEKSSVNLRDIQNLVIKKIIDALRKNGIATNFICELAARIGKTILFLELARKMHEEFNHEAMFIMAYGSGLSVKTSYQDECAKFNDFSKLCFVDASADDAEDQYKQAITNGQMPIVFVSLNPDAEKHNWINQLTGTYIALLEECDFGAHTDNQIQKVDYILENKKITRFNASGTNVGRLAKAFGKNAINEIISVPYCMVEQDTSIPNVVTRRFYNILFHTRINKLLEDFDEDLLPNITKILSKSFSQQKFISALFRDMFGYQPIYGFNLSDAASEEILHSMLFVTLNKKQMEQLAKVIETACPEHKVLILNGTYTNNKEAEGRTKEELIRLQNGFYTECPKRNKLLVITNMMGTRSYSVPEIQACLFMQEGGDVYPYMQKYSRCLTPGFDKEYGHIFDFSFDQSKTRNTVMAVAVEATLMMRLKGSSYPESVRAVMDSVNIKDVVSGKWIAADDIINQFEDNNKLLEIANAHTRITLEDLTLEEIEAFGELAKRSSGSKKEKSNIDKIVKTGKTFATGKSTSGRPKKNPLKVIVEKAIRMINGSATTVLALTNYCGNSFLECVSIIEKNLEMSKEFAELYGIDPSTIKRLASKLELPTLDIIVTMSKYNKTQKHIENNSLAIIKDDPELWMKIFSNRKFCRFLGSKSCKKILVVAGGHGSEIDVLVDKFGLDIIKKIVYNDKYSFLCNQIKRKYPGITVEQGNFLELEFKMKFDVIIGNPPFQDPSNPSKRWPLWEEFLAKSLELSENVAMVVPQSLTSPGASFESIKKRCLILNIDVSKYFNVGSTFCYFVISNESTRSTKIITDTSEYQIDISKFPFLPNVITNETLSNLKNLLSRKKRKWQRGELHTSKTELFSDLGKYEVMHTNAQIRRTDIEHINKSKIRVAVSLSGYPTFNVIQNQYVSQACFWTEFETVNDAKDFANECNGKEIQELMKLFKWSGWNSKDVIQCL